MVLWQDDAEQPREVFGAAGTLHARNCGSHPAAVSGSTGIPAAGFGRARDAWERLAIRYALVGLSLALLAILGLVLHMRLTG